MSHLAWQIINACSPEYRRFAAHIRQFLALPLDQARARRDQLLARYLRYAHTYSPYWRARWPRGLETFQDEQAEDVLRQLPPLTKDLIRAHLEEIRVDPARRQPNDGFPRIRKPHPITSGGSTGTPVTVYSDADQTARSRAVYDYFYQQGGQRPGAPMFYIWGSARELDEIRVGFRKRLATRLRGLIPVPAFGLTPARLRELCTRINEQTHVQAAMCYVTAAETLMNFVQQEGIELRRLRRVFTGGGLLHDHLRAQLQAHLADEVFDLYAGRDLNLVGIETPAHDGLALAEWFQRIEVLGPDALHVPDSGLGEVHVTSVHNFACCLIRLASGDTARWHARPGRNALPVAHITDLRGRVAEHLRGPGGVVIDPIAVLHVVGVVIGPAWVEKFQLVQRAVDRFELHVVPRSAPTAQQRADLAAAAARHFSAIAGAALTIHVLIVSDIPPMPSGKYSYCRRDFAADTEAAS